MWTLAVNGECGDLTYIPSEYREIRVNSYKPSPLLHIEPQASLDLQATCNSMYPPAVTICPCRLHLDVEASAA